MGMSENEQRMASLIALQNTQKTLPSLTKREWFAGLAISVINWHSALRDERVTSKIIAEEAVGIADALIMELAKEGK